MNDKERKAWVKRKKVELAAARNDIMQLIYHINYLQGRIGEDSPKMIEKIKERYINQ